MSQPEMEMDVAMLAEHAAAVEHVAELLDGAASTAGHLDLHDEVYGEWPGTLIVPFMNLGQDHALRTLRGGTDATAHLADVLRSVAQTTQITDAEAAVRFREAGS